MKTPDETTIKEWVAGLLLLREAVRSELQYAQATTYCSDCPKRFDEDEDDMRRCAVTCCREDGSFDAMYEADYAYIDKIDAARVALLDMCEGYAQ